MEYKLTSENFETEVLKSDLPVLVDFYADWCGPCQMMMPIVEEMSAAYEGKVKVGKVNTDEQPQLSGDFGVMSIPTFLFIKDGKVVEQVSGMMPKEALAEKLDALSA